MATATAQYDMVMKSKPVMVGPNEGSMSEVFGAVVMCHFEDEDDFTLRFFTDIERQYEDASIDDISVINNQDEDGQPSFRHSVLFVAAAGLFGSFFGYQSTKTVPTDGAFEINSVSIIHIPRPELAHEFVVGGGTINDGW